MAREDRRMSQNNLQPPSSELDDLIDLDERAEPFPDAQPISYFGTDFDVHGLVRRLNQADILIPSFDPDGAQDTDLEGFQRGLVWRQYQKDRFVESLLLGYPVPGIFLVQQPDKKLLVLDGQQRLRTLQSFYGVNGMPGFALKDVADIFIGLRYDTLLPNQRRSLDNTFIHGTIVKYDPSLKGDDAVYQVFERLNTGGSNLTPHEIRVALYNGELVRLLRDLNNDKNWRELYGPPSARLKDHELILRFAAFLLSAKKYHRPLKRFLNEFVREHRDCAGINVKSFSDCFRSVCTAIAEGIGRRAFRTTGQLNAALADSVMIGVARRLAAGPITDVKALGPAFDGLLANEGFLSAVGRATADEDRVERRLSSATLAFGAVQ
jgi:hypothetical protein